MRGKQHTTYEKGVKQDMKGYKSVSLLVYIFPDRQAGIKILFKAVCIFCNNTKF